MDATSLLPDAEAVYRRLLPVLASECLGQVDDSAL